MYVRGLRPVFGPVSVSAHLRLVSDPVSVSSGHVSAVQSPYSSSVSGTALNSIGVSRRRHGGATWHLATSRAPSYWSGVKATKQPPTGLCPKKTRPRPRKNGGHGCLGALWSVDKPVFAHSFTRHPGVANLSPGPNLQAEEAATEGPPGHCGPSGRDGRRQRPPALRKAPAL